MDPKSLIHRYLLGEASEAERDELDRLLREQPELRREFVRAAAVDTGLREMAFERAVESHPARPPRRRRVGWVVAAATLAACVLLVTIPAVLNDGAIATLATSENAAWESDLPTTTGSQLVAGLLRLKSGVATIRFHSGAEVLLEAPAELELIDEMRGRILAGAAVVEVPEQAVGFVIETPDGYAVDYGTQFAVVVDPQTRQTDFELLEGEISVHHPPSGDQVRLAEQGRRATVSAEALRVTDHETDETATQEPTAIERVAATRSTSVIRNNKRAKYVRPELLTVKQTGRRKWDQRSLVEFDLSAVDLDRATSARLRLNLVPSTRGFASRLPRINRFGVYGVTDPDKSDWKVESLWDDAPGPDDGALLGTFDILRSRQRGVFGIQNDELLNFLRAHRGGPITLILVRETTQLEGAGAGPGLTHMFASPAHPESVGPMLEFTFE